MTKQQADLLEWLCIYGGSAYVDRYGRVVTNGEAKPQGCSPAWLKLIAAGYIDGAEDRLRATDKAVAWMKQRDMLCERVPF